VARTTRPGAATLLAAALVRGSLASAPAVATVTAVVSYSGPLAARAPGVRVVATYPALRMATVRGTPYSLARLAGTPGVHGIAADVELAPQSHDANASDAVLAWERLGGDAGQPGAGEGVRVALVDTGVSDTAALSRASGRLVDATNTSTDRSAGDGYGHGTFMAGIIAGGAVKGTGSHTLGVASGATLLNVKVANAKGVTSLSRVVAGLDWVAAHAASVDVAAFAFSRSRPGPGYGADPLTDAVERVRDAGVVIAVSAGNIRNEVGDPGFDPKVLTVGAADVRSSNVTVAPFSGSAVVAGLAKPDLVASGVGVLSVLPPDSAIAKGNPDGKRADGLWRGSGTSEATAQAAGAAALFLHDFPGTRPVDVKASLRSAARPLSGRGAGAGLLRYTRHVVAGTDEAGAPTSSSGEWGFDANSWSANSWSANSWSANSWSANSWSANSWSANSWSGAGGGRA
jgi:serine protease AprX